MNAFRSGFGIRLLSVLALVISFAVAANPAAARTDADDFTFVPLASGLFEFGSADPVWFASELELDEADQIADPASGAQGFILVTDGIVAVHDDGTDRTTLLQPGGALFLGRESEVSFEAIDDDATSWRIAVVASGDGAPIESGDGVGDPVQADGVGDSQADDDAVRLVELRAGRLAENEKVEIGGDDTTVPLLYALVGDFILDDDSGVDEEDFAPNPAADDDGVVVLTADGDDGVAVYVSVGPSLDPSDLAGSAGKTTGNTNTKKPTPTPKSGSGSGSGGNSSGNSGTTTDTTDDNTDTPDADDEVDLKDLDSDGDGLNDQFEMELGTDRFKPDTDGDGLDDFRENRETLTDPEQFDMDGDGLSDGEEILTFSTGPTDPDTDADGLFDGEEVNILLTNPLSRDSDSDSIDDASEIIAGTNPMSPDSDNDGLPDPTEAELGTNPTNFDTDGDTYADGVEIAAGTNPLDPASHL